MRRFDWLDEGDVARPRHRRGERRVQPGERAHDAEAVRADDAHRSAAGLLEDLPFQRHAGLAGFPEAGRDHDRAFRAGGDALADDVRHARSRRDDDGEIDGVGDRPDRFRVRHALMPSTLGRFGLIGNTVPPNGLLIRFQRIVRPTLSARSVAPMTAMLRGAKIASSGCSNWKMPACFATGSS